MAVSNGGWVWWVRWARRRRWWLAVALAVCGALLRVGSGGWEVHEHTTLLLPATPAHAARVLADFTHHPRLYPHVESWSLYDEANELGSWRYTVSFRCGERCQGAATVLAWEGDGDRSKRDDTSHRVLVHYKHCTHAPLLSWPQFCTELETESVIESVSEGGGGGGDCSVRERATAWCGAWRAASGGCRRDLRAQRALAHRQLTDILGGRS